MYIDMKSVQNITFAQLLLSCSPIPANPILPKRQLWIMY